MKPNRHALIFSTVWPEPDSSAAGVRQMQWIQLLLQDFEKVSLISPAKPKGEQDWGRIETPPRVEWVPMPLNDWSWLDRLREMNPELVLFDRFLLEEQFGAMVYEAIPNALVLIETQDLHLVRRARERARQGEIPRGFVQRFYETETAIRETAAIERADFSFVVSSFEERLLREGFGIGAEKQAWIPFFYDPPTHPEALAGFQDRSDFVWIGNFRHAPNADGLRFLRESIWPGIRRRIPSARCRVYGAYPSEEFMAWNRDRHSGIEVMGHAKSLAEVFSKARVNLAALRFGAGVKGKILEGFRFGVPAVTTWIGAEGLIELSRPTEDFPGRVVEHQGGPEGFIEAAIRLYQDSEEWGREHEKALALMKNDFSRERVEPGLRARIHELLSRKRAGILPVWRSRILRHELMNSRKYFSKWIEEKERER